MIMDKLNQHTNAPPHPKKKISRKESSSSAPRSRENPPTNPILIDKSSLDKQGKRINAPGSPEKREKLLQSNNEEVISINPQESSLLAPHSQENPYNNPILIGDGSLSVTLDEQSGKECFMIGARGLKIEWEGDPRYWSWPSSTESRFSTVTQLLEVYFFDVKGYIETRILDTETTYAAYLVFKFAEFIDGFHGRSMKSIIYLEGSRQNIEVTSCELCLPRQSRNRGDQWMEIKLGQFTHQKQNEGTLVCHLFDHNTGIRKSGIIIQGIEVRPRI